MPTTRSLFPCSVLIGLLSIGCRADEPARIGDAYPRDGDIGRFLEAIRPSIESTGVRISPWTVTRPGDAVVQLNTEQATVFADDPSVIAVVGHPGSRDALLGAAVYNERGIPQVVPNATSGQLRTAGPWTFPLVPSDSVEGAFIAHYALDSLRANRISVLHLGDEYGIGMRDGVRGALLRRGTDVVDASIIPANGCLGPATAIHTAIVMASLQRARPDVVVIASGSSNGWCLADLVHAERPNTWILFGDSMDGARRIPDGFDRLVPGRVRGVEFWAPGTDSLSTAFVAMIRRTLNRAPDGSLALQFDAFMLLAAAIREAGADRTAVREWLESLGRNRGPWRGVTGPIAFNRPRTEILRMSGPDTDR
jgi:branched-chain amino acid transport system substrate-binding protein